MTDHLLPGQRAQAVSLVAPTAGQLTPAFYGALNRALITISTQVETLTSVVSTLSDANGDLITVSDLTANAEELERIVGMQGSGLSVRTPGGYWFGRALTQPLAGLTVSNGDGVSGNPTIVLANDLAAVEGLATNGVAVRTGADTWATRTLTAPAAGFTITNPAGIAGEPTFVLVNDLGAVEGLSTTGGAYRTASDTWTTHALAGTLNRITVTNGDGVAGPPTFDIAATYVGQTSITTLGTIATGTWQGTIIGLAYGGTGAALADPNADRIMFWDDSAGAVTWLTLGTNLTITDTTLNATGVGGGVTPIGTGFRHVTTGVEDAAARYPTKAEVGLGSVDNTSDANKPVSTAQATANTADRDRANHTGAQAIATVTGLQGALDAKLDDTQATVFGLSLLDDVDAAAGRTTLGLGTAATTAVGAYATAAQGATADSAVQPARGLIQGLKMQWVGAAALTVSSGSAQIESTGTVLAATSAIAKTALVLTANTWHHVYLYSNAGTPDIEVVTTVPATAFSGTARSKTGDTTRRYVGSVRTNASGNIYAFLHAAASSTVFYQTNVVGVPFEVVIGGTASTATSVSCSSVVPVTGIAALTNLTNNDSSVNVLIGNSTAPPVNNASGLAFILQVRSVNTNGAPIPLNSSQEFQYLYNSPPTGFFVARVNGYIYER